MQMAVYWHGGGKFGAGGLIIVTIHSVLTRIIALVLLLRTLRTGLARLGRVPELVLVHVGGVRGHRCAAVVVEGLGGVLPGARPPENVAFRAVAITVVLVVVEVMQGVVVVVEVVVVRRAHPVTTQADAQAPALAARTAAARAGARAGAGARGGAAVPTGAAAAEA